MDERRLWHELERAYGQADDLGGFVEAWFEGRITDELERVAGAKLDQWRIWQERRLPIASTGLSNGTDGG